MKTSLNHIFYNLINYILRILPFNFFIKILYKINDNTIILYIKKNNIKFLLNFLKNHYALQFKTLISITAVDYPQKKKRFEINYFLLSYLLNIRIIVKIVTDDITPLDSINLIYPSSSWYEREVWDLFGVFFSDHNDLRRILTDYGFEGYPFRKDFPQSGFLEVRYDDEKKYVLYEPLEISQEFRFFDFTTPWLNVK
jgi:NADH/F420H2 dehydrogenase subunit C